MPSPHRKRRIASQAKSEVMNSPTSATDMTIATGNLSPNYKMSDATDDDVKPSNKERNSMILDSLDPLDPRKISFDIFELYCQEMLMTSFVGRRVYLIDKTRYMMRRLIGHQYDYGRLYNRTCIANIVARVCGRRAYGSNHDDDHTSTEEGDNYKLAEQLIDFAPSKWKKVIHQFTHLRDSLVRNDASLIVLPGEITEDDGGAGDGDNDEFIPQNDDDVNEAVASRQEFSKEYARMLDCMKFHACLSFIQPRLDKAIQSGSIEGVESVAIPHEDIIAFDNAIGELFDDADNNNYALILDSLLDKNKNINRSTRYGGLHLKSFEEIREICQTNNRHFDLERFQLKFLKLIRRWTELALPVPELVKLQYGVSKGNDSRVGETMDISYENKENIHELAVGSDTKPAAVDHPSNKNQNKRGKLLEKKTSLVMDEVDDDIVSSEEENEDDMGAVATLKRKRKALKKSVKDPLEKCVAIAASAPTHQRKTCSEDDDSDDGISNNVAKKSSFLQKKATAKKLAWSDSSSDDESEKSESKGVALSAIPDRFESSDQGKAPTQAPREIQISLTATTKKRNKFTESEDMAIKNGLRRFGEGNWVQIKSYYAIELKDRGAVQIKDRYRTLKKNNEI